VSARVSVVVPCFNQRHYLRECIESLRTQDLADWEMIVVDDCSTDGDPAEVLAEISDERIYLVRHEKNRGLGAARNTGFTAATAPLVLPLDSDDALAPTFLSALVRMLDADAELDCAFADFELFGATSGVRQFDLRTMAALAEWQWLPGAGVLMKRELWQRAGGYSEAEVLRRGNEDWDFWLRAGAVGFRAALCPEPLYRYRQHAESMTLRLVESDHLTRRHMAREHRAFLEKHGSVRQFLAGGYWRSADLARRQKRLVRSVTLGVRALVLDGDVRRFVQLARNNAGEHVASKNRARVKSAAQRVGSLLRRARQ